MEILATYINGSWHKSAESNTVNVINPANQELLVKVPMGVDTAQDVQKAVEAASRALPEWRNTPVNRRVQPLFKLKALLEENELELARLITDESGKTKSEAVGELTRAIENVETACGMPMLIQSEFSENIASGVDEFMIRQPVGVCACISPFNFPGMIPFWFLPYAIACGNTFILKPSEKVPRTMQRVYELLSELDLPDGVLNLVHGGKETVDALLEHPDVKAISFVGSSGVAKYIYRKGAQYGKRVQAQGGAKNPVVVLPDADIEMTTRIINDSVYGCAGQRCLAASTIITVGGAKGDFRDALISGAEQRVTGYGFDDGIDMGPVISKESKERILGLVETGLSEGAKITLDGRHTVVSGFDNGNFIGPTILEGLPINGELLSTEIFGPVMSLLHMDTVEDALAFINGNNYGNMACLFTSSGANARKFRNQADAGNIGINIGVAAPMAQFPFSGWKESFFGDLHGQGKHAVEFFTQTKVVIERWPKEWSRKF